MRQAITRTPVIRAAAAAGLACGLLFIPTVYAADASPGTYQQQMERCKTMPDVDQKACEREVGAAQQAAQRGTLTEPGAEGTSRVLRCDSLPANQREDCMHLMTQPNTTEQGSVESGGILRQSTITIPAPAAN